MPIRLTAQDYHRVAAAAKLAWTGGVVPRLSRHRTEWECLICGRQMAKTYRTVKQKKYGCRCQSGAAINADDCYALALELGISWIGEKPPINSMDPTTWQGKTGNVVVATYRNLKHRMSQALEIELGLVPLEEWNDLTMRELPEDEEGAMFDDS